MTSEKTLKTLEFDKIRVAAAAYADSPRGAASVKACVPSARLDEALEKLEYTRQAYTAMYDVLVTPSMAVDDVGCLRNAGKGIREQTGGQTGAEKVGGALRGAVPATDKNARNGATETQSGHEAGDRSVVNFLLCPLAGRPAGRRFPGWGKGNHGQEAPEAAKAL